MAEEKTTNKKETTGLDQFSLDKLGGIGMSAIQPKSLDNTAIDKEIAALEKPAGGSVYDKMAARYRSQGEGAVLRTQKNLGNLFLPTINLIKEREAAAEARFTLLKDKMPEFDDSTIFGNQSGNEMPIKDYVMGVSKSVKEDLRMLSRLNINDERYDEIKKRVDKNQKAIVDFDDINQQLLKIRNTDNDESQWSKGMDQTTTDMWRDIYSSKGENIKIVDGKLVWTDTTGETSYDISGDRKQDLLGTDSSLGIMHQIRNKYDYEGGMEDLKKNKEDVKKIQKALLEITPEKNLGTTGDDGDGADGNWGDLTQAAYSKYFKDKNKLEKDFYDKNLTPEEKKQLGTTTGTGDTRTIDLSQIGDGPTMIDNIGLKTDVEIQDAVQGLINSDITTEDPRYDAKINQLVRKLNSAGPKGIKSLIFDGIDGDPTDPLSSTNTDAFIEDVIRYNHGESLSETEIDNIINEMRGNDVTFSYKNSEGKSETLQSQYIKWYRNQIDLTVKEGKKSKIIANAGAVSSDSDSGSDSDSDVNDDIDVFAGATFYKGEFIEKGNKTLKYLGDGKLKEIDTEAELKKMKESLAKDLNLLNPKHLMFAKAIEKHIEGKMSWQHLDIVNRYFQGEINLNEMEKQIGELFTGFKGGGLNYKPTQMFDDETYTGTKDESKYTVIN